MSARSSCASRAGSGSGSAGPVSVSSFEAPFGVDLRGDFDWKVSGRVAIFAEGRNLLDRELYEYPWFPELGARFTVGVKANF